MDLADLFQKPRPNKAGQTVKLISEIFSALITLSFAFFMIIFILGTQKK